jgi:hypothetical protein
MTNANIPLQALHVVLSENIAHQAYTLALVKIAIGKSHNARGVLPPMLQYCQCVINRLVDITGANYAD